MAGAATSGPPARRRAPLAAVDGAGRYARTREQSWFQGTAAWRVFPSACVRATGRALPATIRCRCLLTCPRRPACGCGSARVRPRVSYSYCLPRARAPGQVRPTTRTLWPFSGPVTAASARGNRRCGWRQYAGGFPAGSGHRPAGRSGRRARPARTPPPPRGRRSHRCGPIPGLMVSSGAAGE